MKKKTNEINDRDALRLRLRHDFPTFIHQVFRTVSRAHDYHSNWHIDAMARHLEQCANGNIKRLLITVPPRHLKSICASVAFPAWLLGHDPTRRIVCVSYAADLAIKHAQDCRVVINDPLYRAAFPKTRISREKNKETDFMTTQRGYRYSVGVGGTLTGRGGDTIIIDDPIKPEDAMSQAKRSSINEWFDRTLYTRLDDKRQDVIIIVMQRVHAEDLAGHVLSKEEPWVHLDLPAIARTEQRIEVGDGHYHLRHIGDLLHPEREPQETLDRLERELGSFNYSAQYQQLPVPWDGEVLKWEWFGFYTELPPDEPGDETVQCWDTAFKAGHTNDFSVCTTWRIHRDNYYLVDVLRKRMLYPDLKRCVIAHAKAHRADLVLVEDKSSGTSLLQDLYEDEKAEDLEILSFMPVADKVARLVAVSPTIESGRVHLPAEAPWLDAYRAELMQFPNGRYDDQVDSTSQFLYWAERKRGGPIVVGWL